MDTFDNIYKRILYISNSQTQMDLAAILEISQSSISDAKRRQSIPSDWLIKLYDKFGANPDWLRHKKEPMYMRSLPELGKNLGSSLREDTDSLGFIAPVFDTTCTFDNDKLHFTTTEETLLPNFLQNSSHLVFRYNAVGMEPTLTKNCLLGIDTNKNENKQIPIVSGEIYALYNQAEGIIFRRLLHDFEDDTYLICYEESKFPNNKISLVNLRKRIIGKLAWVLHTY